MNKQTDLTTKLFYNLVEIQLKKNGLWMTDENKQEAAEEARCLFIAKDYSSEEATVEDVLKTKKEIIRKDFKLKISFQNGVLNINYMDGSDMESYRINSDDDIFEKIQSAVMASMNKED